MSPADDRARRRLPVAGRLRRLGLVAALALAVAVPGLPSETSTAGKPVQVASVPPQGTPEWDDLETFAAGIRGGFRGVIAYHIEDLQTGRKILWNEDRQLPAGSVIKLPIAVGVFERELAGELQPEAEVVLKASDKTGGSGVLKRTRSGTKLTVGSLVELMLQKSDNTATNILTDLLGLEQINEVCRRQGLTATCMPRYIMDLDARDNRIENYTSATDMARLLKALYAREILDPAASVRMLEILKGQKVRDRLPRYLPPGVVIAHKTGLMKDACHDVGILYGRRHDYVVAVLTSDFDSTTRAKQAIGQLGRAVYRYDGGEPLNLATSVRRRTRGGAAPVRPGQRVSYRRRG